MGKRVMYQPKQEKTRSARTPLVPHRLGVIPAYLKRGGSHSVKLFSGTKAAAKRLAIREQLA